ncbi:MAG: FAD-dependent monooxygenase [Alphaproteobacteria bacterium]|nr:FAD-dependent monooxygenase [Alphaproteobacteria bacterium]
MTTQDSLNTVVFDCVVLGAGLVGAVIAKHLSDSGLNIGVVEAQNLEATPSLQDGRTTAISYGSAQILKEAGLWDVLSPHVNPIASIKVFEANTASSLTFNQKELNGCDDPMGYMIDNALLRQTFQDAILTHKDLTLKHGVTVQKFTQNHHNMVLTLSDNTQVTTKLVVASEGRHSPSRAQFAITATQKEYGQTAMVGTVIHEKPHNDTAFEVFHPRGPLALLPLATAVDGKGIHKSAIVWSSKDNLKDKDESDILAQLQTIFPYLGSLSFASKRMFYPLSYLKTSSLVGDRYALVGDAGHVMHPVAGQGVNLGWRDAKVLWDLVLHAHSLGLDMGAKTLLTAYNRKRQRDQKPLLYITHSLIKLFGIAPEGPGTNALHVLRSYGLGIVNRVPPLKRFLMKKAMGV